MELNVKIMRCSFCGGEDFQNGFGKAPDGYFHLVASCSACLKIGFVIGEHAWPAFIEDMKTKHELSDSMSPN